jgi:hypothetical protein
MGYWGKFIKWWYFVNRYKWSTDIRCGCEVALHTFLNAEKYLKKSYEAAAAFEATFREMERDHKILIYRTRRLEQLVKDGAEFEFDAMRTDILDKLQQVRTKYKRIERQIKEANNK